MMKGFKTFNEEVYQYIADNFGDRDEFLSELNVQAEEKGFPGIQIAPEQLAYFRVLLKSMNAQYAVEIGTLAGYSTIGIAQMLSDHGMITSFEKNARHAEFAARKAREAGLAGKVQIHVGDAMELLPKFTPTYQFDFAFIDGDKKNYLSYFTMLLPLMRHGGVIVADNVLAWGNIADADNHDELVESLRAFNHEVTKRSDVLSSLVPLGDGMLVCVKL